MVFVRTTPESFALANSVSFNPVIAASPHREVIFSNVEGCGTRSPRGIRQNRRHASESITSAQSRSKPRS